MTLSLSLYKRKYFCTSDKPVKIMSGILEELLNSDPFSTWWPFIIAVSVGIITTIRSYFGGPHCPSEATITGKTVVITGGSNGIGLQVVVELLKRGGVVIVGSRDPEEALRAITKEATKKKVTPDFKIKVKSLNLSSLKSVKKFVEDLSDEPKIDILINNAGVAFQDFNKTPEGFETHLITNYLSHFVLTHLLLKKLKAAGEARVINVSAQAHYVADLFLDDMNIETNYHPNKAFGQSKLALVMMARHMSNLLKGSGVTINAMHPGLVRSTRQYQSSKMFNSFFVKISISPWVWLFMKSPEQGAQTIIYMAVATELKNVSGKYFSNCKTVEPSDKALDDAVAEELYQKSLELTGLTSEHKELLDSH